VLCVSFSVSVVVTMANSVDVIARISLFFGLVFFLGTGLRGWHEDIWHVGHGTLKPCEFATMRALLASMLQQLFWYYVIH
jgi:hypothetical protein